EDAGEDVAERRDEVLDLRALARLRDERARQERAERDRVAELLGRERHRERQPDARDEQRLGALEPRDEPDRPRYDEEAGDGHEGEGGAEPGAARGERRTARARARREGRQEREEQDRGEVLDDEDTEDELLDAAVDLLLGERAGHDHRARDRERGAAEQALAHGPAEGPARQE